MITGYASIEGAIEAIKTGAEEYLAKPFTDEELFDAVRRALAKRERRRQAEPERPAAAGGFPGLIGDSPTMRSVYAAIRKAAEIVATVLITGRRNRQEPSPAPSTSSRVRPLRSSRSTAAGSPRGSSRASFSAM
jgi:YesN/AraC family two-component response regulator